MKFSKAIYFIVSFFCLLGFAFGLVRPVAAGGAVYQQCVDRWAVNPKNSGKTMSLGEIAVCQNEQNQADHDALRDKIQGKSGSGITIGGYSILIPQGFLAGGIDSLWAAIRSTISLILALGTVLALIFLLVGGIRWIMSAGDKEAMAKAKGTVTYALVGLVLLLFAFTILGVVQTIFKVNLGVDVIPYSDPNYFPITPSPIRNGPF